MSRNVICPRLPDVGQRSPKGCQIGPIVSRVAGVGELDPMAFRSAPARPKAATMCLLVGHIPVNTHHVEVAGQLHLPLRAAAEQMHEPAPEFPERYARAPVTGRHAVPEHHFRAADPSRYRAQGAAEFWNYHEALDSIEPLPWPTTEPRAIAPLAPNPAQWRSRAGALPGRAM